jgi:hypothetical protein
MLGGDDLGSDEEYLNPSISDVIEPSLREKLFIEMPMAGKPLGFEELSPNKTAQEFLGHLQTGDPVAIVSRFGNAQPYVLALHREHGLQVRVRESIRCARLLFSSNPATIFLRCFEEYENANLVVGQAQVQTWPTYDFFYQGNRVARLESSSILELEELLQMYQFQNSDLDLFSEEADNQRRLSWGNGSLQDATKTPRTTNRFLPGYDWNTDKGFFDELGDKFQEEWDAIYGNWTPDIIDDDQYKK